MPRSEFPLSVRKAALKRANGVCECGCGVPFDLDHPKGCPTYDHELPDFLGGANDLENCKCIRVDCHQAKSSGEAPQFAKVRRESKRRTGLMAPKSTIPGSRGSKWKRKIGGQTVLRGDE